MIHFMTIDYIIADTARNIAMSQEYSSVAAVLLEYLCAVWAESHCTILITSCTYTRVWFDACIISVHLAFPEFDETLVSVHEI